MPFENLIPPEVMLMSGSVYYSGTEAFSGTSPLYLLGLNPGGNPLSMAHHTVERHLHDAAEWPSRFSAYRDQVWENGRAPGTWGLQPQVLHLLARLGLDPGTVPSSNLVFARSAREATMGGGLMEKYADDSWPFHAAVIESLGIRAVGCFGKTAGWFARQRLNAHDEIDRFQETNRRGWTSRTHVGPSGVRVVTLTHPSIADWRNPAADVSALVERALGQDMVDRHPALDRDAASQPVVARQPEPDIGAVLQQSVPRARLGQASSLDITLEQIFASAANFGESDRRIVTEFHMGADVTRWTRELKHDCAWVGDVIVAKLTGARPNSEMGTLWGGDNDATGNYTPTEIDSDRSGSGWVVRLSGFVSPGSSKRSTPVHKFCPAHPTMALPATGVCDEC